MKTKDYKSKPIKKTTVAGEKAKYYVRLMEYESTKAISIEKYVLSKDARYAKYSLVKKQIKEHYLFYQHMSFTIETFQEFNQYLESFKRL